MQLKSAFGLYDIWWWIVIHQEGVHRRPSVDRSSGVVRGSSRTAIPSPPRLQKPRKFSRHQGKVSLGTPVIGIVIRIIIGKIIHISVDTCVDEIVDGER